MATFTHRMNDQLEDEVSRAARGAGISRTRWINDRLQEATREARPSVTANGLAALDLTDLGDPEVMRRAWE